MTKRNPVSTKQNKWFDSQQVDDTDLSLEQNYNDVVQSGMITNHIGNGILQEVLNDNIIFDSSVESAFLDGVAVYPQSNTTDNSFGNQLEIVLSGSKAAGKRRVKVAVIGLDFQSNLFYETFAFSTNETQISKKHFAKVLLLLFNDFIGDSDFSLNLGGQIVIKEAKALSLSRDPIMLSQDVEPNLFFRDFFLDGPLSIHALLKSALPLYNVDSLSIVTSERDNKILGSNDVVTKIGQKFKADTNNIQKITLLMSVVNQELGSETDLAWSGDLILSVYPLQSTVDCPTDIAPNLEIDFEPSNIPVAQLSFNYTTLRQAGTVLDSVPQPVDFVLSNTILAAGNALIPGRFYAFTLSRSGSTTKCELLLASGNDIVSDSRITTFTGTVWVDLPDEDLWFQIWTDAAKISDGQAYENGHGIIVPKVATNSVSLTDSDYSYDNIQFSGNDVFRAWLYGVTLESDPVEDQRTGNPVTSRKQYVPNVELLNTLAVANLDKSDPIFLGAITDKNRKFYDSVSSILASNSYFSTIVGDELLVRVITDETDTGRFDTSVTSLETNLLLGDFVNAKIFPNSDKTDGYYRVASASLCSMIVGDANGDGIIDETDSVLLNSYLGYDLNKGLPTTTSVTTNGIVTTFANGYKTYTVPFSNQYGVIWQLVNPTTNAVVASGVDGVLVANPLDKRLAQFTSASEQFNIIVGLSSYKLVLVNAGVDANYGGFNITSLDSATDVLTIQKVFLDGDAFLEILRSDIDGDGYVSSVDQYLLTSYVDRQELSSSPTTTYPQPSTNAYTKLGTRFNVLRFKLEPFVDRKDDYSSVVFGRPSAIHVTPDLFLSDNSLANHDFYNDPVPIRIEKQLTWEESLIVVNSNPRSVPAVFNNPETVHQPLVVDGVIINKYEVSPTFAQKAIDNYIPNDLIIGGDLKDENGNFYKVDFDIGSITLEIPDGLFGSEKSLNIMDDFVVDYSGYGTTRLGFASMRFSDCSYVTNEALANDQVRFSVAVQSFSPNVNGLSPDGYEGAIVDGKIGVSIDHKTGIIKLNFSNLYEDAVLPTLNTKLQISVFLKKGGFNNAPLFVDSNKLSNMLQLISVFSGANEGGPSALVDMGNDVAGILPILHGGTGLNAVGAAGTVLTSNGSSLSYQFIANVLQAASYSLGVAQANKLVQTDGYGFIDPSLNYKNPVYIYGVAGKQTNNSTTPVAVGAFPFTFEKYILEGVSSIKLEVIASMSAGTNTARVILRNLGTSTDLVLSGANAYLNTAATTSTRLISDDIKTLLSSGSTPTLYEVQLRNGAAGAEVSTLLMARLVIEYNNPVVAPPQGHSWNFVNYLPSPTPIA